MAPVINSFLEGNRFLSYFQSGFYSTHNKVSGLLKVTEHICSPTGRRHLSLFILFNFSKFFHCIYQLSLMLFSGGCIDLLRSYLYDCQQCVRSGDGVFSRKLFTRGVPQAFSSNIFHIFMILKPLLDTLTFTCLRTIYRLLLTWQVLLLTLTLILMLSLFRPINMD